MGEIGLFMPTTYTNICHSLGKMAPDSAGGTGIKTVGVGPGGGGGTRGPGGGPTSAPPSSMGAGLGSQLFGGNVVYGFHIAK
jgi:hypothetical protein